jgi:hypothetical protein
MNCCDDYGNCRQGRDCPIRREITRQGKIQSDVVGGTLIALSVFCLIMLVLVLNESM